ncbi:Alpha-amylase [Lachnellula subtilissima]|uniref:Alpha-amylase n=1 Tax=Lachnellula subtilissima TaxID=602034 RepID=A0A8H8UD33_9HELO|nr:Alpha-amylase [Lachnellula subtilissima]
MILAEIHKFYFILYHEHFQDFNKLLPSLEPELFRPEYHHQSFPRQSPAKAPLLHQAGVGTGMEEIPAPQTVYPRSHLQPNNVRQTPPQGGPVYDPNFGAYRDLVGYADIQYSAARTAAAVVINAASRTGETLAYSFNGETASSSNVYQVTASFATSLSVAISTSSGKALTLDPINFIWQSAPLTTAQSSFQSGQKGGMAELFGWLWVDVGKECAFLGKAGYMEVKIWPPNEHVWGSNYYETDKQFRPWYFVYQPVSYRLRSRTGTRDELRAMKPAGQQAFESMQILW